jgi:lipoate-protein ligase A
MLSVLNTPFEKISDKAIATVEDRITTVRRECGRLVPLDEARGLVRDAYARTLGVELIAGDFTPDERVEIAELERERYTAGSWIHQEPAVADSTGSATLKTAGGLVSAHLTLAGDVIKALYVTGDFFCEESVVMEIERALRWHSADPPRVARTLATLDERGLSLPQITSEELARVIAAAAAAAQRHEQGALAKGCFVNP